MKKTTARVLILSLIVLLIVLAVPCFQFYNSKQKTQEKIDGDFVMSIARISAGLNKPLLMELIGSVARSICPRSGKGYWQGN
ncbi:hypothetical protein [Paenibacillus sp. RC84]|uniref:hypothetical protein n=1 Tax=Paenibacillus sp. RC84 TaxID=3156252 RepID=UPI0035128856